MSEATDYPDPKDKPPARRYAEARAGIATLTIADPENPEAFVESDTGVSLGDMR